MACNPNPRQPRRDTSPARKKLALVLGVAVGVAWGTAKLGGVQPEPRRLGSAAFATPRARA